MSRSLVVVLPLDPVRPDQAHRGNCRAVIRDAQRCRPAVVSSTTTSGSSRRPQRPVDQGAAGSRGRRRGEVVVPVVALAAQRDEEVPRAQRADVGADLRRVKGTVRRRGRIRAARPPRKARHLGERPRGRTRPAPRMASIRGRRPPGSCPGALTASLPPRRGDRPPGAAGRDLAVVEREALVAAELDRLVPLPGDQHRVSRAGFRPAPPGSPPPRSPISRHAPPADSIPARTAAADRRRLLVPRDCRR